MSPVNNNIIILIPRLVLHRYILTKNSSTKFWFDISFTFVQSNEYNVMNVAFVHNIVQQSDCFKIQNLSNNYKFWLGNILLSVFHFLLNSRIHKKLSTLPVPVHSISRVQNFKSISKFQEYKFKYFIFKTKSLNIQWFRLCVLSPEMLYWEIQNYTWMYTV